MQKLTLMLACLSSKPIIILDEPTAGLDAKSLKSCVALIQEMQKKKMILIITHDLDLSLKCATDVFVFQRDLLNRSFFSEITPL